MFLFYFIILFNSLKISLSNNLNKQFNLRGNFNKQNDIKTTTKTNIFNLISSNPTTFSFDTTLYADDFGCQILTLYGPFTQLNLVFDYDGLTHAAPYQASLAIFRENSPKTSVLATYYSDIFTNVTSEQNWPNDWPSFKPGIYAATIDISSISSNGFSDYKFCFGNDAFVGRFHFKGNITINAPISPSPTITPTISSEPTITSPPSITPTTRPTRTPTIKATRYPTDAPTISFSPTFEPTSSPTFSAFTLISVIPTKFSFDITLSGGQMGCNTFRVYNSLTSLTISLKFPGTSTDSWISDLAFGFSRPDDPNTFQVGGFELEFPNVRWKAGVPGSWQSSQAGIYRTTRPLSAYGVPWSGGADYQICMLNAWGASGPIHYSGNLTIDALITRSPTISPTNTPTFRPTINPSITPTTPTRFPTRFPTTVPTRSPTRSPTNLPTRFPTFTPTRFPTRSPTTVPTRSPTRTPTNLPTRVPTFTPTRFPTRSPTTVPTRSPTRVPTTVPTRSPTIIPTILPTRYPTTIPTRSPTRVPTTIPTRSPTGVPTRLPSRSPTTVPTRSPTRTPTTVPTRSPTRVPTRLPTRVPTFVPTRNPTRKPSLIPTRFTAN